MIAILTILLLSVCVFELQRYLAPVTLKTNHDVSEQSLPDGSTVVLNTHSRLSLSNDWKKDEDREAWLEGEAFFNVAKVADTNGFTIHTPHFDVVALHAKLNLLNRSDTIQAWLQDGAAFILTHDSKPKKIMFAPGDLVEYTHHQIIKTHKETGITAWKTRK